MLKQQLQASQLQLRDYEWVETTAFSMKGEQKARKQNTCYYGAEGTLQKEPITDPSQDPSVSEARGPGSRLKNKAVAQKKEELSAYMQQAAALIHTYLPPDPSRIQQAVGAGRLAVNPVQPGRRVRLEFKDYLKPGDLLSIDIELPTNRLLGMAVSSYLDTQADEIRLDAVMGVLPDGTIYTARTHLDAPAEDVAVVVENAGYRRIR